MASFPCDVTVTDVRHAMGVLRKHHSMTNALFPMQFYMKPFAYSGKMENQSDPPHRLVDMAMAEFVLKTRTDHRRKRTGGVEDHSENDCHGPQASE